MVRADATRWLTRLLLATASVGVCWSLLDCGGGAGGSGTGGAMGGHAGTGGGATGGTAGSSDGGTGGTGGPGGAGTPGSGGTGGLGGSGAAGAAGAGGGGGWGSGGSGTGAGAGGSGGAPTRGCAAAIDGGRSHNCATRTDGTLWCWGRNNAGQLGDGTTTDPARPVQVTALGTSVARPSAGDGHTCARKTDDTLWCWGSNGQGRLGDGTTTNRTTPVQVTALGASVVAVSAGAAQTCARKADGTLWCWGANNYGAVGDGTMTDALLPVQVTALGSAVAEVAAGASFTCARKTDNTLWCWGYNGSGQLGDGTMIGRPEPAQVTALGNTVAHVAVGYENACVLKTDGTTWCWGANNFGGVGDGTTTDRPTPTLVPSLATDAIQLSLHEAHACARKTNGTIWCWGDSHYGSLGEEEGSDNRSVPIQVKGFPGMAVELTTGRYHSCARLDDGTVWCWGYDTHGELGAGTISAQLCYEATNRCRPAPGPVMLACP